MYFDKEFEQAKGKFRAVNVRGGQSPRGPWRWEGGTGSLG